jgi:hypothetical protein
MDYHRHESGFSEFETPSTIATTHARVFVDLSEKRITNLTIVNVGDINTSVTIKAFENDGITPAGKRTAPQVLLPHGYSAALANQLITGLPSNFTGILDISSPTPVASLALRTTINERRDSLITAFPVIDESQPASSPIVFPYVVSGGGYTTQFILIGADDSAGMSLDFYEDSGEVGNFIDGGRHQLSEPIRPDRYDNARPHPIGRQSRPRIDGKQRSAQKVPAAEFAGPQGSGARNYANPEGNETQEGAIHPGIKSILALEMSGI